MNILLVTLDQLRGDASSAAGHPLVRTPNLDRLAAAGVRFAAHYSQSAPCGPGRASLYTGMYAMNHRVVGNGTPLDRRFDNVALAARRAGFDPTLFGYTDQSVDPRDSTGPSDPRLQNYEGVLPGFAIGMELIASDPQPWLQWLRDLGYRVGNDADAALASEPARPAECSMSAFLTDRFLQWHKVQRGPWFAHLSQLRPHPPYAAAGHFARMYHADELPPSIAAANERHRLHDGLLRTRDMAAPREPDRLQHLQTQYYGMVSEADHQLGRVWDALHAAGEWDDTFIVVTADHGEQLGDHGLIQKGGFFEQSYHVPCIVRDPRADTARGTAITRFTENVDILPTLCEAMAIPVPDQCDGLPLTPFLRGEQPPFWRDAAHWEFDWRGTNITKGPHPWPWDRRLERQNLCVRRSADAAYVHFGNGDHLCFDLAADPTWRTPLRAPARVFAAAQAMLTWRAQHNERTLTGLLVRDGGVGRWPEMPEGWGER